MADGSTPEVEFSRDELRFARAFVADDAPHSLALDGHATALTEKQGRISRFKYFVQCARDTWDVAMKIAQYYSDLESLVSLSHSELSHQVAERIACLLMQPGEPRVEVFNKLKQGYNLRSQAVHGASFNEQRFATLRSTSVEIDKICRLILHRICKDEEIRAVFDRPDEEFTAYFQRFVLGIPPPKSEPTVQA